MDEQQIIYVDNSILKTVAECSTEAVLRYVLGYTNREENVYLKSGSAGHLFLADWAHGRSKEKCFSTFDEYYKEWAEQNVPSDDRCSYGNCVDILDAWFDAQPLLDFPVGVNYDKIEIGCDYPLTDYIHFVGKLDLIVTERTGTLAPLDHKFTGRINDWFKRKFRNSSQLSGYCWLMEQTTGEKPMGAYVNAVEMSKLPSDDKRKCREHGVVYAECGKQHMKCELIGPIARTQAEITEWKKTAIHLANKYIDLMKYNTPELLSRVRTQGKFHDRCGFCSFYDYCAVGRPTDEARFDGMLMYEPWLPKDFVFDRHGMVEE